MAGQVEEGMYHYKEALSVWPTYGPALYNIGVVWSEAKDVSSTADHTWHMKQARPVSEDMLMGFAHLNNMMQYRERDAQCAVQDAVVQCHLVSL